MSDDDTSDIPDADELWFANAAMRARAEFHEIWWIYAHEQHPWGGLKIAHFRKPINSDDMIVIIMGETDPRRLGVRDWKHIEEREGWVKVKRATLPTRAEIDAALDAKLREIANKVTNEVLGPDHKP